MIQALKHLKATQARRVKAQPAMQAFMIKTQSKSGLMRLFATHPPLEERIARLAKK